MKKKITIIGAGISGLYLAHLLEESCEITILEARDRVGGRVFSIDGHDMGPSWVWSHHTSMLQLIDYFDLKLLTQYTQGYTLYDTKDKVEHFMTPSSGSSVRIDGSMSALIEVIYKSLKSTKILFSQEVQSITKTNQKVVVKTIDDTFSSDFSILAIPPRLAVKLDFSPRLPSFLTQKMVSTPTWMGNTAKCVIEFKTPFWKENFLSGFIFSHVGPLGEIHDASTTTKHALFGFVSANANMESFEQDVKAQLQRLFKIDLSQIISIYLVDWRSEKYTASIEDIKPMSAHPSYGIDTDTYSDKIFFSATEFSFKEGGYLEGALLRADYIAHKINLSE